MTELIARLRKEAQENRDWASAFAPDMEWCVSDVDVWTEEEVGHAARGAFHQASLALDLEAAADALERVAQIEALNTTRYVAGARCDGCWRDAGMGHSEACFVGRVLRQLRGQS